MLKYLDKEDVIILILYISDIYYDQIKYLLNDICTHLKSIKCWVVSHG